MNQIFNKEAIKKFLGSNAFLAIGATLLLMFFLSINFGAFNNNLGTQAELLDRIDQSTKEIIKNRRIALETQEEIEALRLNVEKLEVSNRQLQASNLELVQAVCSLQLQVESLGAEPVVPRYIGCNDPD